MFSSYPSVIISVTQTDKYDVVHCYYEDSNRVQGTGLNQGDLFGHTSFSMGVDGLIRGLETDVNANIVYISLMPTPI